MPRLHGPDPPQGKDSTDSLSFSMLPPHLHYSPPQGSGIGEPKMGLALVQTGTLTALVQTGTLTALIQTGTG